MLAAPCRGGSSSGDNIRLAKTFFPGFFSVRFYGKPQTNFLANAAIITSGCLLSLAVAGTVLNITQLSPWVLREPCEVGTIITPVL